MEKTRGLSLLEVLVVLLLLAVIGVVVWLAFPRDGSHVEPRRRMRCRSNLSQVGKGMAIYLVEHGGDRWYPFPLGRGVRPKDYNGAEWLASLYWTGIVADPGVFICPSSRDTNSKGQALGTSRAIAGRFGSQTVSYAGLHHRSLTDAAGNPTPGAIPDDFPAGEPMASDDTQGTINHGARNFRGMSVLFVDGHVEFKTDKEIDVARGVGATAPSGQPKPLLWRLRN